MSSACEKACPESINWVLKIGKKDFNHGEDPLANHSPVSVEVASRVFFHVKSCATWIRPLLICVYTRVWFPTYYPKPSKH